MVICWSCAQQGSPTGGPRDEDPPVVTESEPPNYSTRFKSKKVLITFDEYIVLDNVNQELVVSPPMEEKPEIKLRKKTLIIEFEEDLKDSTTYTFNFGSAIKDLHEGNKLLNFEYVFSTGDVLDSLSIKGTLQYAEDLSSPEEPIYIMLYEDLRDSVPLLDIPLFVGRSDDSGVFSVNNLKASEYKVFALKDGNYNLLFDLPTEEIAFLDTSLTLNAEFIMSLLGVPDTAGIEAAGVDSAETESAKIETAGIEVFGADSIGDPGADSIRDAEADSIRDAGPDYHSIYIDLMLFTEETEIQYLMDNSREDRRMLQLVFARPLTDSFNYQVLSRGDRETMRLLEHFSPQRDTLSLWIRDSLDFKRDTLSLQVNYTVKDTMNQNVTQIDTLKFTFREKQTKKKSQKPKKKEVLSVSTIGKNKEIDLHRDLYLDLDVPLETIHDSLINIFQIPDSVEIPVSFNIRPDSLMPVRSWISVPWKSASRYRMLLLPGALESIYEPEHDTIDVEFKTRDIEYYGQILLNLENVHGHVIVQLLSKDKIASEQIVEKEGLCTFSYLAPKDYTIKCIHDRNRNGRWDTGKYMEKRQPESVEILSKAITVRSNWDHDVTLKLEKK